MSYLKINQNLVNDKNAQQLIDCCPFGALSYNNKQLSVNAACKLCKVCLKQEPIGLISLMESEKVYLDKSLWQGIAVFIEQHNGIIHDVAYELLGKALQLAKASNQKVYALIIGAELNKAVEKLSYYQVDKLYVYQDKVLADFHIDSYVNIFADFIDRVKPSVVMVGGTNLGRVLGPRIAAFCRSGLTADCTKLAIKENGDLIQIRPAFGGDIMAEIVTANHRPQFCTVRPKIFATPLPKANSNTEVITVSLDAKALSSVIKVINKEEKAREKDIVDAEVLVVCGRGFIKKENLYLAEELALLLGGMTACTRPLVEMGWCDAKRHIGLSGRTVKPKLLIAIGISGAIQFAVGVKSSDFIIAINNDEKAPIFNVADIGIKGDLLEILPLLIKELKEEKL